MLASLEIVFVFVCVHDEAADVQLYWEGGGYTRAYMKVVHPEHR